MFMKWQQVWIFILKWMPSACCWPGKDKLKQYSENFNNFSQPFWVPIAVLSKNQFYAIANLCWKFQNSLISCNKNKSSIFITACQIPQQQLETCAHSLSQHKFIKANGFAENSCEILLKQQWMAHEFTKNFGLFANSKK